MPAQYFKLSEIDPPRDAARAVREYVDEQVQRLGCLMPAIGEALEGAKIDVHRTQLYEDIGALAVYAKSPGFPAGDVVLPGIMGRVGEALRDNLEDVEGVPLTIGGFILRAAMVRLALATDVDVSSSDIGTLACLSPSRIRQIGGREGTAAGRNLEKAPGQKGRLYTAASARRFLASRGVTGL